MTTEQETPEGQSQFTWTDETLTPTQLSRQIGARVVGEAHIQVCAGIYYPEEGEGGKVVWRFYKDPEWECEE